MVGTNLAVNSFRGIYRGKKVLITGNTGFKGSWLTTWLTSLGADVYGFSLDIPTEPSMHSVLELEKSIHHVFGDIEDKTIFNEYVQKIKPDFIFHLAAQAIVSKSYSDPFQTVTTNIIGTAVVLEAIRNVSWKCVCILITSDKAYDNVEWIWGYREDDALGGKDVYSGSKGGAELVIKSYWHSFIQNMPNIKLSVVRAGNVIGGGDWALDRIVVDCVKAFDNGDTVEIRSPMATRPWQHVLEPLSGYLTAGLYLWEDLIANGEAFNFGPKTETTKTVYDLTKDLALRWGHDADKAIKVTDHIPFEEAKLLKLNCDKANQYLKWHSTLNYDQCVGLIADWYLAYNKGVNMYDVTRAQIDYFTKEAQTQNLEWAYDARG